MNEHDIAEQAYKNGYEKGLQDALKWIPVTERLPEDSIPSTFYLGYWNGYIRVVKYWRTRKVFELRGKTVKVTHWMPLPSTEGLK